MPCHSADFEVVKKMSGELCVRVHKQSGTTIINNHQTSHQLLQHYMPSMQEQRSSKKGEGKEGRQRRDGCFISCANRSHFFAPFLSFSTPNSEARLPTPLRRRRRRARRRRTRSQLHEASALMQILSYLTETVKTNTIVSNRIVISFKDSPGNLLRRRSVYAVHCERQAEERFFRFKDGDIEGCLPA